MNQRPLFAAPRAPVALRTQADCIVTSAGVVIGCRYTAPAPRISADAESIQIALLAPRRRPAAWQRALAAGLAAMSIGRTKQ
jgi:hypothetical protein